ncbi:hypothetical protein JW766_02340 [Candidatus Dojkabacteria bacterium]|nr:hypothetical protein [Candidatus Dojkabacteria bacterium]
METATIQSWRNRSWNLRLEAKENSSGCIAAPIGIIRFLAERMKEQVGEVILPTKGDLKLIEPIIILFSIISIIFRR